MNLILFAQQVPDFLQNLRNPQLLTIPPEYRFAGLALYIVTAIGLWKVFTKAGKPGWAAIIPIYNVVVTLEITGKPIWWTLLIVCCPCIGVIPSFFVCTSLAKSFGQEIGFGIGLFLLWPIFMIILGFGDSKYLGPAG